MTIHKLFVLIFYSFIAACCSPSSVLPQKHNFWNQSPATIADPERIAFEQICNGHTLIPLGTCNNAYVRCSYNSTGHCVSAAIEECLLGKIFDGKVCEVARNNCINTKTSQMDRINFETEKLLEEMNFCYSSGSGIYMFPEHICSRQAYICKNYHEGFTVTCPPGMIILRRPFGCFISPSSCTENKVSVEQFAPLRQYAIKIYCINRYSKKQNYQTVFSKVECTTWYVGCRELIKDIIYCENGFIYDTKLGSCRLRKEKDRCITPDFCMNRNWRTVSLGDCNRHFIYCRGQVPQQFVCAEGFIFSKGRCVPIYQSSDDQCWECQDGDKRHTSLHSCSEYSICEKDHWEDRRCPLGMIFSEIEKMCQVDPSCAHPAKCKMGTSYHLRCNEYLICSWKGIFEHRFCPPFYRWDNRNVACIPDSSCLPFTKVPCRENEIVSSFDCKFYHQCSDGEWHRKPCPIHPTVICGACYHSRTITWEREMHCMNGDTVANSQDCQSYAICDGGKWKSARCKFGLFWNENLQRCDYINQCSAVKRAACNHRQRLAGLLCNEYIECIQGSWILMKCLPGYAFDRKTKKCTFSNDYVIPDNDYLNVIEDDIADLLPIFESERKVEQNPRRVIKSPFPYEDLNSRRQIDSQNLEMHCQFGNKIRNEYDCKRYFECEENKYRERYCEDNDEFNDENGRCEKDYRCNLSQCRNGRMIENEICGHYQICINGKWQKGVCEGSRQFANGHCQLTYCNDDNDEISSLSTSCEEGNVLADDIDCKRYFICRNGRFQEQFCWNGTSFDKKHRYCARSTNCMPTSGCIEADVKANGEDHSTYQICKDGKFELRPCPYGLIYNPSKRTCEKGSSSTADTKYETCEESGDAVGYRADPIDCRKFYQCAHGKWVSKTCPAKLYWNMEKTTCDWPYNVESCK